MDWSGSALQYASLKLRNDKEIVLAAVKKHGLGLQFASAELKKNKDIVLAAVNQTGDALEYASEELKKDKDIVMAAVNQNGRALAHTSPELQRDKEIVRAALDEDGASLEFCAVELKSDKEFVFAALKKSGYAALDYASDELQNDESILRTAVVQNIDTTIEYISKKLKALTADNVRLKKKIADYESDPRVAASVLAKFIAAPSPSVTSRQEEAMALSPSHPLAVENIQLKKRITECESDLRVAEDVVGRLIAAAGQEEAGSRSPMHDAENIQLKKKIMEYESVFRALQNIDKLTTKVIMGILNDRNPLHRARRDKVTSKLMHLIVSKHQSIEQVETENQKEYIQVKVELHKVEEKDEEETRSRAMEDSVLVPASQDPYGYEFVKGYTKKNGTKVESYYKQSESLQKKTEIELLKERIHELETLRFMNWQFNYLLQGTLHVF